MANEFVYSGTVTATEEKTWSKGTFLLVYIDDHNDNIVPFGVFDACPEVGQEVRVSGRVVERNGYSSLRITSVEINGVKVQKEKRPPSQKAAPPQAESTTKPVTEHFNDDDLPF